MDTTDIIVENHGSIFLIRPVSDTGHDWLDEHVSPEPWQLFGGALAVDPRCAWDIVQGMQADGLNVI
jgi:hypothetical protein